MTTDITELAQRMKAAAGKATPGRIGDRIDGSGSIKYQCLGNDGSLVLQTDHKNMEYGFVGPNAEADELFFRECTPDNILALVEALEKAQCAGSINNQWKPDVCPITGRRFFLWIEHPEFGYVPTYGGPYDSYTIPTRDSDGEFSCERYDHDFGGWVEGECVGAYLIDDDEQSRVYELEQRIAELESRTVTDWIEHDGKWRPESLGLDELVYLKTRKQELKIPYPAGKVKGWMNTGGDMDVMAYKLASPQASTVTAAAPQSPGSEPATVPGEWIPVSEQMPPSRHEVLVGRWWGEKPRWCCKWATYIPGHPDAQSSGWLIPGASWTPTHWMPLPAAPQEPKP
nr:DUF551 domain-containing protein [Klebsiella pneumoniae]